MKKTVSTLFSLILSALMVIGTFVPVVAIGIDTDSPSVSGTTKTLYNGVTAVHYNSNRYSNNSTKLNMNVVEFDPTQSDLYLDVVGAEQYGGTGYSNGRQYLQTIVNRFNSYNPYGRKTVAAINCDLWMCPPMTRTGSTTSGGVTYSDATVTATLNMPRGFNAYDGEIITSPQIYQEEPYQGDFCAFGYTSDGRVTIGYPRVTLSLSDNTKGLSFTPDGLNRLPANNALVVYSDKGCYDNYTVDGAYQIVIDCGYDYKVQHGAEITGTVSAIYPSTTSSSAAYMAANRLIINARGSAITSALRSIAIGDSLSLGISVYEKNGYDNDIWQNVQSATGGQTPFVLNGVKVEMGVTDTNYPDTLIGIKNDGSVVFITGDSGTAGTRKGFDVTKLWTLADDYDLYSAFMLDGGGSVTMVQLDGVSYKTVSTSSDGSAGRTLTHGVILSYGAKRSTASTNTFTPPCETVDRANYYFATDSADDYLSISPESVITRKTKDGVLLNVADVNGTTYYSRGPSAVISYLGPNTVAANSNSVLNGTTYSTISADEYKYLVIDEMLPSTAQNGLQIVWVATGSKTIGSATSNPYILPTRDGQYHQYVIDCSELSGRINFIRLQYYATGVGTFGPVTNGDSCTIRSVHWCKTQAEVTALNMRLASLKTNKITFNANGGFVDKDSMYVIGDQTYSQCGGLPTPTRTGYAFSGWRIGSATGALVTDTDIVSLSSDTTLFATWQGNSAIITFEANGGSGAPSDIAVAFGGTTTIPETAPTKTGNTFEGWSTSINATSAEYQPGDSITVSANTILYAVWSPKWIRVSYDAAGGTGAPGKQGANYGDVISLQSGSPTWSGRSFLGWSKDPNAETPNYQPGGRFTMDETSDITLYAVWSPKAYVISFSRNKGKASTMPSTIYKDKGTDIYLPQTVPERDGYTFAGWGYDKNSTIPDFMPGDLYDIDSSASLFALWKQNRTITLNPGAGSITSGNSSYQICAGDSYASRLGSMPTASLTGMEFIGWHNEAFNYMLSLSDTFMLNEDIEFEAVFVPSVNLVSKNEASYNTDLCAFRVIFALDNNENYRNLHTVEIGGIVGRSDAGALEIDSDGNLKNGTGKMKVPVFTGGEQVGNIYSVTDDEILFSLCLININDKNKDYSFVGYVIYEDDYGNRKVVYTNKYQNLSYNDVVSL